MALSFVAAAWPAAGQQSQPRLETYADSNQGFALDIPADWSYDRADFDGPGGSTGVLRGVSGDLTLQVYIFAGTPADPFDAWVAGLAQSLRGIGGVEDVTIVPLAAGAEERPAGRIEVDALVGGQRVRSRYHCVRMAAQRVLVLVLAYPREDPAVAAGGLSLFERCADALTITFDPERAAALAAARERGRAFIQDAHLHHAILRLRLDQEPHYYRIERGGKSVGYLERRYQRAQHSIDDPRFGATGKDGLQVGERVWRFEPDGAVAFTALDLFSSVSGTTDLYEISEALVPAAAQHRPRVVRDEVLREGDGLVSSVRTSQDLVAFPDPRPKIRLPDDFLGLAWRRALPAILAVSPETPGELAFSVYDASMRRLTVESIRPLASGELEPVVETLGAELRDGFEIRRGFEPQASRVYVDRRGHMLRLDAPDGRLVAATAEQIEELFAKRREAAATRLTD